MSNMVVTIAFALFWAWQTSINFAPVVHTGLSASLDLWYVSNCFVCVVYALMALGARKVQSLFREKRFFVAAVACQVTGTALRLAVPVSIAAGEYVWIAVVVADNVFLALGTAACNIILFSRLLEVKSPAGRSFVLLAGTELMLLLYLCIDSLPYFVSGATILLLPVIMPLVLHRVSHDAAKENARGEAPRQRNAPNLLFFISFFVFALSLNFIRGAASGQASAVSLNDPAVVSMAFLFIAAASIADVYFANAKGRRVSSIILVVLITSTIFCLLFRVSLSGVIQSLSTASFFFFVTMLWRSLSDFLTTREDDFVRTVALTYTVYTLGLFLGSLLFRLHLYLPDSMGYPVALLVAYAVFIVGVLSLRNNSRRISAQKSLESISATSDEPAENIAAITKANCRVLADGANLTPREFETLCLLASGQSMQAIAKKLTVTVNTVKTHAAHIYQKLDLHSREEIILELERIDESRE